MMSKYDETWGTNVGEDCVSLNTSLCQWLGTRLVFLGSHTKGHPMSEGFNFNELNKLDSDTLGKVWRGQLTYHGQNLMYFAETENDDSIEKASEAMMWVALNWQKLWD